MLAVESIKGRYEQLVTHRQPYLQRARDCSRLTIPALIPKEGATATTRLITPHQSTGARGVNNLASKMLGALFPANAPFFRLSIDDFTLEELTQQEGMRAAVEEGLDKYERAIMSDIESRGTRPTLFEALKHLLVGGNVLLYALPEGGLRYFRLDRYVVKRDPMGNPLEVITKENISPLELPPHLQAVIVDDEKVSKNTEDSKELYTRIVRTKDGWEVSQEIEGNFVEESFGTYTKENCPWLPLRFIKEDGEDYGRSYVEEYLGDLSSFEKLRKAILQASAASAKVIFLVKPNSTTKMKMLAEAESGDIREGNPEDVGVLQVNKQADLQTAERTCAKLEESLSYIFLLNSAIQRNGERVTAEEIRYMAQELDSTLSGVYSMLAQDFQLPFINIVIAQMEKRSKLPPLPKEAVKPTITTGIEALGRGNDLTKLAGLLQDISAFGPEVVSRYLKVGDYIKRCGAARGIDMKGLIPTEEEIQASEQQSQMMALAQKLGPNAINQMGAMAQSGQAPETPQQ